METLVGRLDDTLFNPSRFFEGHTEARLAKLVGLTQFGVNMVRLGPGSQTALRHWHEQEDEFVYVMKGTATLIDENGPRPMHEGEFVGFPAGSPNAHHILNRSTELVLLLVVGSRRPGQETIHYPDDSLGTVSR